MKNLREWFIAGAMATAIGCGDDPVTRPPPRPPVDVPTEDMKQPDVPMPLPDVEVPDVPMRPDVQNPDVPKPSDVSDLDVPTPPDVSTPCTNPGETRCGDTCVDTQTNNANCGMCGRACSMGESCRMGACMADMPCMVMGETRCGMSCVNTATDTMNCGSCGTACMSGQTCSGGTCMTPTTCMTAGEISCGGTCVNPQTNASNCGRCGNTCAMGMACRMGSCVATVDCSMMPGTTSCAGTCVNLMTDAANCGTCGTACMAGEVCMGGMCAAMPCGSGETRCGTTCVNIDTSATNCGRCGRACAPSQTCTGGMCVDNGDGGVCMPGQTMCAGGACVNTATDPANCGACGRSCAVGQTCMGGMCQMARPMCMMGQTDCAPMAPSPTCVDLNTSATNCGACGTVCPMGTTCTMGRCTCPMSQTLCGRTCVNTQTDRLNCGTCGTMCPAGQVCTAGACACPMGQAACGGACVNTQTDNSNCGRCGAVCSGGQTCQMGMCQCAAGQMLCGMGMTAACANLMTDRANCGACGRACAMGQSCMGGVCACPAGTMLCGTGAAAACVNLMNNASNCGACGRMCATGQSCMGGVCRGMPPANDTRAGATLINLSMSAQTLMADTTTATHNTNGTCGCTATGNDVFYRFVLTQPEVVYADTIGAGFDTSLFLQDAMGNNVVATGSNVTCNDDLAATGLCPTLSGLQSQIVARLAPGTYFLVLSGCGAGPAAIKFQHVPAGSGTSARITPNATSQTVMGAVAGTGTVSNAACCSGGPENSYWWVTCPSTPTTTFQATSCSAVAPGSNMANYDIEVAVYSALRPGTSFNACNDDVGSAFACNAGSSLTASIPATMANQVGLNAMITDSCAGTGTYTVRYVLANCAAGTRCGTACTDTNFDENNCGGCDRRCAAGSVCSGGTCFAAPANDTRAGATTINLASPQTIITANNAAATNDVSVPGCACTTGRDVFYTFTLTRREIVYADTIGSARDTSLFFLNSAGAYVGTAAGLANGSTCNDDGGLAGCSTGTQSQVMALFAPGTYYLVLSGCGEGGPATIRFHHLPVGSGSVNLLAAGVARVVTGTTAGMGVITSSCCSGGPENTYYWYTCQGAAGGAFTADTCGRATWDTELDQRSAARTAGVAVCNDDTGGACGFRSTVATTIPAGPGLHTLYIDGCGTSSGPYGIQYTRP